MTKYEFSGYAQQLERAEWLSLYGMSEGIRKACREYALQVKAERDRRLQTENATRVIVA